ncbi:MAG: hypothetical protein AB7F35_15465 [Acetobacteraceae bacterium]
MAETDNKAPTHTAYAFRREGKKFGRLLECGTGRLDRDQNIVHVFMNRLPIGAWSGYVVLSPIGAPPPTAQPQRPGDKDDEDED